MFRGTFTALVTPFRSDGALDEDALVRLVERQLKSGIDGLVLFGTTGEEASLTLDERRRAIELIQKRAEGQMVVVAGAFDNVTERAVTLAREMDWLGVDAILSVVPYYSRPNQAGIIEHFRRIADAVDSPVILSNAPGRVATGLEAESYRGALPLAAGAARRRQMRGGEGRAESTRPLEERLRQAVVARRSLRLT